jgi:hypothetical protein
MAKASLSNKIFNRLKAIPFGKEIYSSQKDGKYYFAGVRDKRKLNETVLYTVPNKKNLKCPNIKGFQREEIDKLWRMLKQKQVITSKEFKVFFPALYKEGGCCVSGFYGIINELYPNRFIRFFGGIKFK